MKARIAELARQWCKRLTEADKDMDTKPIPQGDCTFNTTDGLWTTVDKLPLDHATRPLKIVLAILMRRERHFWPCPELALCLPYWAADPRVAPGSGGSLTLYPALNFPSSQEARNDAISYFMETDAEYLIMIDNDTAPVHPTKGHIINPIDLASWNLPIVAAPVPTMNDSRLNWHLNGYMRRGEGYRPITIQEHQGTVQVDAVGFGLVCIRRNVLHDLSNFPHTFDTPTSKLRPLSRETGKEKTPWVLRSRDQDGTTTYGEDFLFCHRARELGYFSWFAHPAYICDHYHTVPYGKIPSIELHNNPAPSDEQEKTSTEATEKKPSDEPEVLTRPNPSRTSMKPVGAAADAKTSKKRRVSGANQYPDFMPMGLPERTGWELADDALWWINDTIQRLDTPMHILELGSGISTVAVLRTALDLEFTEDSFIFTSIEHDRQYLNATDKLIKRAFPNNGWKTAFGLLHLWYASLDELSGYYDHTRLFRALQLKPKVDLLIVDGPPGQYKSRHFAVSPDYPIAPALKKGCLILWDDTHRPEEKKVVKELEREGAVKRIADLERSTILEWRLGK